MNAVLNKSLNSLGTFACENAGAAMKARAVRVTKLVLAGVLAVPPLGLAVSAVVDPSLVVALIALGLAVFPVAVVLDAVKGFNADPDVLREHDEFVHAREEHWRYFNPDNPAAPLNRLHQD